MPPARPLNRRSFSRAVGALASRDTELAAVVERHGLPPFWTREPGFSTLVLIILEQQVSLASARATFERLSRSVKELTPRRLVAVRESTVRKAGVTRQKTRYCRELARAITSGELDLDALGTASDDEARARLLSLPGIGPWTADIYLLSALDRPDVWPHGDLALRVALAELKGLPRDAPEEVWVHAADGWRPRRAVAARILWHHYLSTRGKLSAAPTAPRARDETPG